PPPPPPQPSTFMGAVSQGFELIENLGHCHELREAAQSLTPNPYSRAGYFPTPWISDRRTSQG
ncbi:MAG: hypothetical protein ACO4AI_14000, partial [Prochlorothrix sp.]